MADFDETFMEALYEQEQKELIEDFVWEQDQYNSTRYTGSAEARSLDSGEILVVQGEIYGPPSYTQYSFVLKYQNTAIRVWDCNDHHEGFEGGHKHRYRETSIVDYEPYDVNDVTTSDVNQALLDFLDECGVQKGDATITQIKNLSSYG